MTIALTTSFAHARVPEPAPAELVDVALRAGASGLVLHRGLSPVLSAALLAEVARRGDELRVVALEAPTATRAGGVEPELCAPDRDEAAAALESATAIVRRAGELRAPFVVVHLGVVRPVAGDWIYARDRFLRGELDARLLRRLADARDAAAGRALDGARRALDALARQAERAGTTLVVRNGRRYVELPTARELDLLRGELSGAPVAPLLDVAAAHLADLMGFAPLALTLAAWASAPLCYFGDACGPIGALAPGRGVVDLAAVRAALDANAALAFAPWPGLATDEVIEALPLVARAGAPAAVTGR